MKDKHSSEVIYALADYKQLVLAYRNKYAQLVKSCTFWKTSTIWISGFALILMIIVIFQFPGNGKGSNKDKSSKELLNVRMDTISQKLAKAEKELAGARQDLARKDELIGHLEKSISTTSKKLLDRLFIEQEESSEAK